MQSEKASTIQSLFYKRGICIGIYLLFESITLFLETLRLYPPVPTLNRECTIDYKIPGTDVVIEKGTYVLISALGLHTDPDIFPSPYEFNPERFSPENKGNIPSYAYLPFGEGPRNCIGEFAENYIVECAPN